MGNRKRVLQDISIIDGGDRNTLRVELYYSLGGWNFFTGTKEGRGLYVQVTPMEIGDGFTSFTAFEGVKQLMLETKRFNQKQLDEFVPDNSRVQVLISHVVGKNKLKIKTTK